jgi:hypothetical protein
MYNPFKFFIASGCSFTANRCWPYHLNSNLKFQDYVNYGLISSGNGRISRSIIYGVDKALRTYQPEDILVGIMWSSFSRHDIFKENVDESKIWQHSNGVNPTNFVDGADKNWILIHSGQEDTYSTNYYKYFYDDINDIILTLEHILRVQWYLGSKGIKYFMTTFSKGVLPNEKEKNNVNVRYLYDMVDWSKFLPIPSCLEWVENCSVAMEPRELQVAFEFRHPSDQQHRLFAEDVIAPYVKENYFKKD